MKRFTNKINENIDEINSITFTKIQEDALRMLRKSTDDVVRDLKKKWFNSDIDDLTWLEEKYYEEVLKNLSEIIARKVKS